MMRRTGTTLVEVLVAIFVMAIGLLTLLTLFPLGALSMSQAIKDDRTAQAAANAAAIGEALKIRNDSSVVNALLNPPGSPKQFPPADPAGPSYPVYVDPIGVALGNQILGQSSLPKYSGIPRISPSFIPQPQTQFSLIYQWFSLKDDLRFQDNSRPPGDPTAKPGTPIIADPNAKPLPLIERESRYTWTYLLKRPKAGESKVTDLAVVVYSGRPILSGTGEYTFTGVAFDPSTPLVNLTYSPTSNPNAKPPVKKGTWILDATMIDAAKNFSPHASFYRVVGVTDPNDGKTLVLELQTNPKVSTVGNQYGVLAVMENVVEVFEKGPGWLP
jgi:hypothetical protein